MNGIIYQKVFDEIRNDIPEGWIKLVFFVAYTEGSYSMKYYYSLDGDTFWDCYSIKGLNASQLIKKFIRLDSILAEERMQLIADKRWNVMTMVVEANGAFKTEYDYSDISENMISYEKKWREKYLVDSKSR